MENIVYVIYAITRMTEINDLMSTLFYTGLVIFVLSSVVAVIVKLFNTEETLNEVTILEEALKNCLEVQEAKAYQRGIVFVKKDGFFEKFFKSKNKEDSAKEQFSFDANLMRLNEQNKGRGYAQLTPTVLSYHIMELLKVSKVLRTLGMGMLLVGCVHFFIPKTRDAVLIASSYGLTKAVQNESVQNVFGKSVLIVETWLDKLNVEESTKKSEPVAAAPVVVQPASDCCSKGTPQPGAIDKAKNLQKAVEDILK